MMKNLTVVYDKRILNFCSSEISHRKFFMTWYFLIKLNQNSATPFVFYSWNRKEEEWKKNIWNKTSSTIYVCEIFMFHIIKDPIHFIFMSFFIIRFIFTALEIGIYVFINVQEHLSFTYSFYLTRFNADIHYTSHSPTIHSLLVIFALLHIQHSKHYSLHKFCHGSIIMLLLSSTLSCVQ